MTANSLSATVNYCFLVDCILHTYYTHIGQLHKLISTKGKYL